MSTKRPFVIVLSGSLGAGKNALLNHVLVKREALHVAVIVNDMREVKVDTQVVQRSAGHARDRADRVRRRGGGEQDRLLMPMQTTVPYASIRPSIQVDEAGGESLDTLAPPW